MLRIASVAVLALLMVGSAGVLGGSDARAQAKKAEPRAEAAAKPADAAAKPPMPGPPQLAIMVQTAVVALSQANLTNNYTVLHALGAPEFQKSNPPEKLAQVFAEVRKIDLTPVIIYSPQLSRPPSIDDKSMLRLTGFYKTVPQQVLFDILYQPVDGRWRLAGLSVGTQAPQAAAAPSTALAEPAAADKSKAAPAKK